MTIKRQISQGLLGSLTSCNWSIKYNCYSVAKLIRDDLNIFTPSVQLTDLSSSNCNARDINDNLCGWTKCEYMRHGSLILMGKMLFFQHVGVVVGDRIYHMDKNGLSICKLSEIKRKYKKTGFYEQSCNLQNKPT